MLHLKDNMFGSLDIGYVFEENNEEVLEWNLQNIGVIPNLSVLAEELKLIVHFDVYIRSQAIHF